MLFRLIPRPARTVSVKKTRLDQYLVQLHLSPTRSQAENLIKLGEVKVNGEVITKPGYFVNEETKIEVTSTESYVSRAALKLGSIAEEFKLNFTDKVLLDVGSSTGGFTDYALQHGAKKSIAVDVGTDQLHPSLQDNSAIELHEQTDIRDIHELSNTPDIVVIDVSFISLKEILPHVAKLAGPNTQIVAMLKPQFEVGSHKKHKGIIKNDHMRREILKDFEEWARSYFIVLNKSDSKVAGSKGNVERFYLLKKSS
jgi:23S rRNA (cytidine1920-2'-O)/16S rRNA (cytidine1409-2'-O)-methyltransferase